MDAEKDENENVDLINLENFSIINGAQTTSALGAYLKNANINYDQESAERLKKVYVLARIMEVTNPDLRDNISIYNNLQNPITSRDMVSNRIEQKKINEIYMQGEKPYIYVEIKRGSTPPSFPRFEKHQRTTNEELAQLAFAAFMSKPFYSKDKKAHYSIEIIPKMMLSSMSIIIKFFIIQMITQRRRGSSLKKREKR